MHAARLARFATEEGQATAKKVADEAVAKGLLVDETAKTSGVGLRNRQFGARMGTLQSDKQPDGKYKKGNEYFGGDSTVFEGKD